MEPAASTTKPNGRHHRAAIIAAWLFVMLAALYFVVRGPARVWGDQGNSDFRSLYAGAVAWVEGSNPYDNANLSRILASRGFTGGDLSERQALQVAPPLVFVLLSPLYLLNWPATNLVWMALNCGLVLLIADRARALARFSWCGWQAPLLLAGTLALAPFHTTIYVGQFAIFSLACMFSALCFSAGGRPVVAGIFYALASAFKPTIAGLFLFHFILKKRWRLIFTAATCGALMTIIAFGRLLLTDTQWFETWQAMWQTFVHGGQADPTAANPLRFQLVNLHVLLHVWLGNAGVVKTIVWGCLALVVAMVVFGLLRAKRCEVEVDDLLFCAIAAVTSLLIVYHRFYDAVLLVFPLLWAIKSLSSRQFSALLALLLVAMFIVPGSVLLAKLESAGRLPEAMTQNSWWHGLLLPHEIWALVLLVVVLLISWIRSPDINVQPINKPAGESG